MVAEKIDKIKRYSSGVVSLVPMLRKTIRINKLGELVCGSLTQGRVSGS